MRDTANVAAKTTGSDAPFTKSDFSQLLKRACETPSHLPAAKSKRKLNSRNRGGYTGTNTRSRGQDAVHQVFLKAIENGGVGQATNKKAYLYACVRNAVLNGARIQDRQMPLEMDSAWFSPPERDYAGEQNLRRALGELPHDQREVVVLHVWCELTFSEVADLLGVSSNTAASRYRYALAKLRDLMLAKENSYADS